MPREALGFRRGGRSRTCVARLPIECSGPLSYTARLVDPTGLKPAPHGLKGRRSVTRVPGQKNWLWRKDSNLRMAALTVRCLTNLATPQKHWLRRRDSNSYHLVYKTSALLSN